ncbi:hypothetical protein F5Y17DRAFT_469058 [Xylariaceae sp. FL0594]|nr:hypothetical protein F5Y17DRAFT_469058 [Xylariaceae sp. FL0594]
MGLRLQTHRRNARQTARLRQIIVGCVVCLAVYCFLLYGAGRWRIPRRGGEGYNAGTSGDGGGKKKLSPDLLTNRFLTEEQCRATFPGLLDQVDEEVAKGPFVLKRNPNNLGPLIARIRDGQLYILSAAWKSDLSSDMLAHRAATLHQISNALLTWPRPPSSSPSSPFSHIPDTILAFNHHDDPLPSTLSYSRPADPGLLVSSEDGRTTPRRFWPIPHFSFYSWPLPFIGSLPRAQEAITRIEANISSWEAKIPKAVWRGTTWFNNPRAGRLRQNLVRGFGTAHNPREWADIEALDWSTTNINAQKGKGNKGNAALSPGSVDQTATNALPIEDFCRYRYIVHTEGVTYSGRFQFHTLCASVVVTPPVAWSQHLTHLLRPVFTSSLNLPRTPLNLNLSSHPEPENQQLSPYPAPWVRKAWPKSYDPESEEANIVFVAPDWSDLEPAIAWLESHPRIAESIARRQRALFHDGGYLSPAAESCYWRGLIRGWSEVVRYSDDPDDERSFAGLEEVTWEEFSLKEIHK